jgi:hypothetical protein
MSAKNCLQKIPLETSSGEHRKPPNNHHKTMGFNVNFCMSAIPDTELDPNSSPQRSHISTRTSETNANQKKSAKNVEMKRKMSL